MEIQSKKSYNKKGGVAERRRRVIKRLKNQLLTGFKPVWKDKVMSTVPLTPADITRIKHEIAILESRI